MSSDRQELSIGTQLAAIHDYAEANHIELVRVYEDAAKSGLQISNREGMKRLLREVMDEPGWTAVSIPEAGCSCSKGR